MNLRILSEGLSIAGTGYPPEGLDLKVAQEYEVPDALAWQLMESGDAEPVEETQP